MDYAGRQRLKIWGYAATHEAADDPAVLTDLHDKDYKAVSERAVIITIDAFDWNCPQHIPQRFTLEEMEQFRHFEE